MLNQDKKYRLIRIKQKKRVYPCMSDREAIDKKDSQHGDKFNKHQIPDI